MAFSFHNLFHFISLLLPVLCSCVESSETDVKASGLINEICPKTRNPTLCFQVLGSGHNVNLRDLGQTSVESAQDSGILASDTIHVLIVQEKNPLLIERYRLCSGNYARANSYVAQSRLHLKSGRYQNLPSQASAALTEASACDKQFVQPPSEPAQLKEASKNFQDVCSILSVISKKLAGQKDIIVSGITLQELALGIIQDTTLVVFSAKDTIHAGGLEITDPEDDIHVREIETSRDPILNKKYHRRGVQYTAAVNALIECRNFLQSGDYRKLPSLASLAFERA
ncbi:hypothetical protein Pfo_025901 [Paulownia fortunei]|nr:hypothetical protein Pfo_025901 [Paulownia fortunei]